MFQMHLKLTALSKIMGVIIFMVYVQLTTLIWRSHMENAIICNINIFNYGIPFGYYGIV